MAISDYSTTASSNTALFPEGMNPSDVNNGMRQVQADVRSFYNAPEYRDLGDTPAYVSGTSFTISGDVTTSYVAAQRLELFGSVMGTLYASIVSSIYSAPNTTITVTMDSGSLTSNLSQVSIGIDPTNDPIPFEAIKGTGNLADKTGNNTFSGDNTFSGSVTQTGKVLTPDDGELTIASGEITVTGVFHTVDTEGDAATDDLVTINGGTDGQILVLRTESDARAVVIKTSGNIASGADVTLSSSNTLIVLKYDGAKAKWLIQSATAEQGAKADTAIQNVEAVVLDEAVATTSGTTIAITTTLPSGLKAFRVNFVGVSTNGTDSVLLQLGDSGGIEATGYASVGAYAGTATAGTSNTSGFLLNYQDATALRTGFIDFSLADEATNTWLANGQISINGTGYVLFVTGSKSLSGVLTSVSLTTTGGANTFDAGYVSLAEFNS